LTVPGQSGRCHGWGADGEWELDEGCSAVGSIWRRVVAFLQWLFAPEELCAPADESQAESRLAQRFPDWLLGSDVLVGDHTANAREVRRRRFLSWVLSAEELPMLSDEASGFGVRWPRFSRRAFSSDELSQPKAARNHAVPQTRFARWVLSSEVCPQDTAALTRRAGGFLRWALSPEVCPQDSALPTRRGALERGSRRAALRQKPARVPRRPRPRAVGERGDRHGGPHLRVAAGVHRSVQSGAASV
jgi:hypothetical protein